MQGNKLRATGLVRASHSQENKCYCCSPSHLLHTSVIVTEPLTGYKHLPLLISPVRFGFFSSVWKEKKWVGSSTKIYSSNATEGHKT